MVAAKKLIVTILLLNSLQIVAMEKKETRSERAKTEDGFFSPLTKLFSSIEEFFNEKKFPFTQLPPEIQENCIHHFALVHMAETNTLKELFKSMVDITLINKMWSFYYARTQFTHAELQPIFARYYHPAVAPFWKEFIAVLHDLAPKLLQQSNPLKKIEITALKCLNSLRIGKNYRDQESFFDSIRLQFESLFLPALIEDSRSVALLSTSLTERRELAQLIMRLGRDKDFLKFLSNPQQDLKLLCEVLSSFEELMEQLFTWIARPIPEFTEEMLAMRIREICNIILDNDDMSVLDTLKNKVTKKLKELFTMVQEGDLLKISTMLEHDFAKEHHNTLITYILLYAIRKNSVVLIQHFFTTSVHPDLLTLLFLYALKSEYIELGNSIINSLDDDQKDWLFNAIFFHLIKDDHVCEPLIAKFYQSKNSQDPVIPLHQLCAIKNIEAIKNILKKSNPDVNSLVILIKLGNLEILQQALPSFLHRNDGITAYPLHRLIMFAQTLGNQEIVAYLQTVIDEYLRTA